MKKNKWSARDLKNFKKELEKDPRLFELQRSTWANLRILGRDKEFVVQTLKLRNELQKAFDEDPKSVRNFFHFHSVPTGHQLVKTRALLKGIREGVVGEALRHYLEYVARFGAVMNLSFRNRKAHFRTQILPPWGTKFHAKLCEAHLRPIIDRGDPEDPYVYQFEREDLNPPPFLEDLIKTGKAKLLRIDDEDGSSVLTEIEAFGYHADGLTFILHNAEMPYIICLIGEKTDGKTWRAAARTVHALQRKYYGRANAGKPADIKQILKVAAALKKAGSSKDKALMLGKTDKAWSSVSAFSRLKNKLT